MNKNEVIAKFMAVVEKHVDAIDNTANAKVNYNNASFALTDKVNAIYLNNDIKELGSNAEIRGAKIASLTSAEQQAIRVFENELEIARAKEARTKAEVEQMNRLLRAMGIKERLTLEVSEFMNKPFNRKALLREFATGEMRFNNPDFIPTHFLEWFDSGAVNFEDVDKFLERTLPKFKFSLRDRGRKSSASGGGSRGIALRVDKIGKPIDEERFMQIHDQLNEGLRDWYASAKNLIGRGWELIVGAVRRLVNFFAGLLSRSFSALLSFLDLEPVQMQYTW